MGKPRPGGIHDSHYVLLHGTKHQNQPSDHFLLELVCGDGPSCITKGLDVGDQLLVETINLDLLTTLAELVHKAVVQLDSFHVLALYT